MKKITFLFLLSLTAFGVNAQNVYNFSASQSTYIDLANPISMNNGQSWDIDTFGPVTIPFAFAIDGVTVDSLAFDDDYFLLMAPDSDPDTGEGFYYLDASTAYIQDRSSNNTSVSPISYKVDGAAGNRIFKVEVKNAGIEEASSSLYLNFQIWLYESDNAIEFHYGQHNITNITDVNEDGILFSGISSNEDAYLLYGSAANPTYGEFTEDTFPEDAVTFDSYPANGTVYKFTPAAVAGLKDAEKKTVSIYPNPATTVLNIKLNSASPLHFTVYDVTGKTVMTNTLSTTATQINVTQLNTGIYFLKLDNQIVKFIKQ